MKLTNYTIHTDVPRPIKVVICSDLHDRAWDDSLSIIENIRPHLVLCPGDMIGNTADGDISAKGSFVFMKKAAEIAPLYYSLGNHELGMSENNASILKNANINLLDDSYVTLEDRIHIGGLTSGYVRSIRKTRKYAPMEPNTDFIESFASLGGFKLLLCHQPEFYKSHLKNTAIDVIVSGHAHGGQWKLFGHGVLAPGQGLFPKYASGVHDDRLCISCGMANTVPIPRFFNPRELVLLNLAPKSKEAK